MAEIDTTSKKVMKHQSKLIPELMVEASKDKAEKWKYEEKLKKFFLSGRVSDQNPSMKWKSLSVGSFLKEVGSDWDYPVILDQKTGTMVSLVNYLSTLGKERLREEDLNSMLKRLPQLSQEIHEVVNKVENISNSLKMAREIIEMLFASGENLIEPEKWVEICKFIEKELVTDKIAIIGYSGLTAFLLFKYQLNVCRSCHLDFLNEINKRIAGLNDILVLHGGASVSSEDQYNFATDLVSFNKIDKIAPLKASSKLPESRLKRIQNCYNILVEAQKTYKEYTTIIFTNKELAETYHLERICSDGVLKLIETGVCNKAKTYYKEEIKKFALVTGAIKVADLELTQQYVEDLHDAYFENYDVNYLGDEDLQFMRTIVLIDYSKELMKDASDFLELVSGGALVNIIGVNKIEELNQEKPDENGYLELASLAFSRRKAFVYQGGVDDPSRLFDAFNMGLEESYPVLWNILVAGSEAKMEKEDFLRIRIARESRLFPEILYNVDAGDAFGSHFDLSGNCQTKEIIPSYNQQFKSIENVKEMKSYLTMADFLAMDKKNGHHLEIIPTWYESEELVPLEAYLNAGYHAMDGKIPYIWGVDEDDKMRKIAIPISWVIFCRRHMNYWSFLQEIGGVNNPLVETAIERVKAHWQEDKETEIKDLELKLQDQFDDIRNADLEKSVRRMLSRLLNGEVDLSNMSVDSNDVKPSTKAAEVVKKLPLKNNEEQPEPEKVKSASTEAWVETDECTSCNDCISAVPGVFKYNDDKQVFVYNPKGAAYGKIVSAAEKCPAACIHPGLPYDKTEANLEKLMKRAEKFN